VPIAELETLGMEIEKLSELESIKEEWQLQAEAQDEVRAQAIDVIQTVLQTVLQICLTAHVGWRALRVQL
jgi:hypothetical protein